MAVVALMSCSGAPGVTTAATGLASVIRRRLLDPARSSRSSEGQLASKGIKDVLLVEASVSGGVLASRFNCSAEPGLVSFISDTTLDVERNIQLIGDVVPALISPISPARSRRLLQQHGRQMSRYFSQLDRLVFLDCGRVGPGDVSVPLVTGADLVALLVRSDVESLRVAATAAKEMQEFDGLGVNVGFVLVGESPWSPESVVSTYKVPILGRLDYDPFGAATYSGSGNMKSNFGLGASLNVLAEAILQRLAPNYFKNSSLKPLVDMSSKTGPRADSLVPPMPPRTEPPIPTTPPMPPSPLHN